MLLYRSLMLKAIAHDDIVPIILVPYRQSYELA